MAETTILKISDEGGLWSLLQQLAEDSSYAEKIGALQITGWSPYLLYFPEEAVGHTVRPAVAKALAEYHRYLQRGYALLAHGQADVRVLTSAEKEMLDIPFLITDGSTGSQVIDEIIDKITQGLFVNMTGSQKLIAIVFFIAVFFGQGAALDWFEKNHNEKLADMASKERIQIGAQEIERMKILADASSKTEYGEALKAEADKSKGALVKSATQRNKTSVLGVEITRDQAERSLAPPQEETVGKRLDGIYKVEIINTQSDEGYIVRLENTETGLEFQALVSRAELTDQDIRLIFDSARRKVEFRGAVNAFFTGDKITRAYLVRADKHEPKQSQ